MKVIPLEYASEYAGSTYGILFESEFVHEIPEDKHNRSYPHRFKVWSNLNRPNRSGSEHKYESPKGNATNDELSVTISTECSVISAHGNGTGTKASGQMWGDVVHVGDVVTLQTPAGAEYGPYLVGFHRWNGLSLTPVAE